VKHRIPAKGERGSISISDISELDTFANLFYSVDDLSATLLISVQMVKPKYQRQGVMTLVYGYLSLLYDVRRIIITESIDKTLTFLNGLERKGYLNYVVVQDSTAVTEVNREKFEELFKVKPSEIPPSGVTEIYLSEVGADLESSEPRKIKPKEMRKLMSEFTEGELIFNSKISDEKLELGITTVARHRDIDYPSGTNYVFWGATDSADITFVIEGAPLSQDTNYRKYYEMYIRLARAFVEYGFPESFKLSTSVTNVIGGYDRFRDNVPETIGELARQPLMVELASTDPEAGHVKHDYFAQDAPTSVVVERAPVSESAEVSKEKEKEKTYLDHDYDVLKSLTDEVEFPASFLEMLIGLSCNNEVVFTFDKKLAEGRDENPLRNFLKAIENLKRNPKYKKILQNLIIIPASVDKIPSILEEYKGKKHTKVFTFAREAKEARGALSEIEAVKNFQVVYINENGMDPSAYYPLAEIVAIALAQVFSPSLIANKDTEYLAGFRELHQLAGVNIKAVRREGKAIIFTLLPNAKALSYQELIQRYAKLKRFLKAA
jgi:hypothetical protein